MEVSEEAAKISQRDDYEYYAASTLICRFEKGNCSIKAIRTYTKGTRKNIKRNLMRIDKRQKPIRSEEKQTTM